MTWHNSPSTSGTATFIQSGPVPGGLETGIYADAPGSGAPFSDSDSTQRFYPTRIRCNDFSAIPDGLNNTIMAGEIIKEGPTSAASPGGGTRSTSTYLRRTAPCPMSRTPPGTATTRFQNNPPCRAATTQFPADYAWRSRHPGGVNVAFATAASSSSRTR